MKFKPTQDTIIVQPLERKSQTAAGLYIPETAETQSQTEGVVIAVGRGVYMHGLGLVENEVMEGDKVLFWKEMSRPVVINGEKYVTMKENSIIAIITEEKGHES